MSARYAMLLAPSVNRVYADQAPRLAAAELKAFAGVLSTSPDEVATTEIGGVPYLTFTAALTDADVAHLSNMSAAFALFERQDELLRPVMLTPLARYDSDLITIPKYAGKTNEQFTKLLLNLTLLASASLSLALEPAGIVSEMMMPAGSMSSPLFVTVIV